MKKYNLQQWFSLLLICLFFAACSNKNFPVNSNADADIRFENGKNAVATNAIPPQVISINDALSKLNKDGEIYYDDEMGYRYWRLDNGKYHLDAKYLSGALPGKRSSKKPAKKIAENKINEEHEVKYAGE